MALSTSARTKRDVVITVSDSGAANTLTNPALDPFGKIPEFKYCAARVESAA